MGILVWARRRYMMAALVLGAVWAATCVTGCPAPQEWPKDPSTQYYIGSYKMEPDTKVDISKAEPPPNKRCSYVGAIEAGRNLSAADLRRDLERKAKAMETNYVVLDTPAAGRAFFCPSVTNLPPVGCEPDCSFGDRCLNGICVTPSYR